jgi:hypothetical protein
VVIYLEITNGVNPMLFRLVTITQVDNTGPVEKLKVLPAAKKHVCLVREEIIILIKFTLQMFIQFPENKKS